MKGIFYFLLVSACLVHMPLNARDEEEDKNISTIPQTFVINQRSSPLNKERNEIELFPDIDDFNEKPKDIKILLMVASGLIMIDMENCIGAAEYLLDKNDPSVKQKAAEILFTIASDSAVSTVDRINAANCLFNPLAFDYLTEKPTTNSDCMYS